MTEAARTLRPPVNVTSALHRPSLPLDWDRECPLGYIGTRVRQRQVGWDPHETSQRSERKKEESKRKGDEIHHGAHCLILPVCVSSVFFFLPVNCKHPPFLPHLRGMYVHMHQRCVLLYTTCTCTYYTLLCVLLHYVHYCVVLCTLACERASKQIQSRGHPETSRQLTPPLVGSDLFLFRVGPLVEAAGLRASSQLCAKRPRARRATDIEPAACNFYWTIGVRLRPSPNPAYIQA